MSLLSHLLPLFTNDTQSMLCYFLLLITHSSTISLVVFTNLSMSPSVTGNDASPPSTCPSVASTFLKYCIISAHRDVRYRLASGWIPPDWIKSLSPASIQKFNSPLLPRTVSSPVANRSTLSPMLWRVYVLKLPLSYSTAAMPFPAILIPIAIVLTKFKDSSTCSVGRARLYYCL